jgi:NAD(P)-dependent dehydrogenase (short-subunit alcohol dehydrogenase family)
VYAIRPVEATRARILADRASIDVVIYKAGMTQIGPFSEVAPPVHRRVFEVNYFGAVHLASAFLQWPRRVSGDFLRRRITPLYHRAVCSASKHALEGYFKTLRVAENRKRFPAPTFHRLLFGAMIAHEPRSP